MNIDNVMRIFADFLDQSWGSVAKLIENTNEYSSVSIDDWLQCNWELLVERKVLAINEYFEVYGAGADFCGKYSRITDIESVETHYIEVLVNNSIDILNKENIVKGIFKFEQLVGFENDFYTNYPSFKYVLVKDKNNIERVFLLEDVNLEVKRHF